eukprot:jgi/Mesen1/6634/ME000034S06091
MGASKDPVLRLAEANGRMQSAVGAMHSSAVVAVGDIIPIDIEAGYLKGHGVYVGEDGRLRAAVCGVVERVNKLISVRPLQSRYTAETGDVIIGRVTDVAGKRWKVDVGSAQDAQLQLSAVNLPGGIQAEVQAVHQDGSLALHTRSVKYGKLEGGQLVQVPPYLIKRLKQHFVALQACCVHLILGCNGYVWVSPLLDEAMETTTSDTKLSPSSLRDNSGAAVPPKASQKGDGDNGMNASQGEGLEEKGAASTVETVGLASRERICRTANAIRALALLGLPVYPDVIADAYACSERWSVPLKDMLELTFLARLAEKEADKRERNDLSKMDTS